MPWIMHRDLKLHRQCNRLTMLVRQVASVRYTVAHGFQDLVVITQQGPFHATGLRLSQWLSEEKKIRNIR